MKEAVFANGKILAPGQARVSALAPGFLCAYALFETMRSYDNKIIYFDRHLNRIKKSSQLMGINFPHRQQRVKKIIKELVKIVGLEDVYIRLTLYKSEGGADILIIAKKYHPPALRVYKKGFCANISRFRQNDCFLAKLKTTNRILYELGFREARRKGFDEAIILNNRGLITEASRSNIFFVKDKAIFTPSLECGCLEGITRGLVFDWAKKYNLKIYNGNYTLKDLYAADEAFLTNSLMGIMPLAFVENRVIGKGSDNRITRYFIKKYNFLLKNGS